jgi:hypothetical protein
VLDVGSGEQAAELAGKFEPTLFGFYCQSVAAWYNKAAILCERNNHGHATLAWLRDHGGGVRILEGHDGKPGWLSSTLGKTKLYDACADAVKNAEVVIRSFVTFTQLSSIDGSTLRAPDGQHDDRADAFALAACGRPMVPLVAGVMRGSEDWWDAGAAKEDGWEDDRRRNGIWDNPDLGSGFHGVPWG